MLKSAILSLLILTCTLSANAQTATPVANVPPAPVPTGVSPVSEPQPPAKRLRFNLGIGVNIANEAKFDNVIATGSITATGSAKYDVQSAFLVTGGAFYSGEHSWGGAASLSIEGARDLNSVQLTLGSSSATAVFTSKPSIQLTVLEANALYRWENIYLPFGFNFTIPKYTPEAGATDQTSLTGALGAQIGVGFLIGDHFQLEAMSKVLSLKATQRSGTVSVNYQTGYLAGLNLNAKYLF